VLCGLLLKWDAGFGVESEVRPGREGDAEAGVEVGVEVVVGVKTRAASTDDVETLPSMDSTIALDSKTDSDEQREEGEGDVDEAESGAVLSLAGLAAYVLFFAWNAVALLVK
jgi:hypothetical protein